jgi:hypothetical protein
VENFLVGFTDVHGVFQAVRLANWSMISCKHCNRLSRSELVACVFRAARYVHSASRIFSISSQSNQSEIAARLSGFIDSMAKNRPGAFSKQLTGARSKLAICGKQRR